MPKRFPRFTDANGCRWGLEQDGSLGLSGSADQPTLPLFKHAARLTVNGQAFSSQQATATPDASRVRLTGVAGTVPVTRDVWIDQARGGTRWVDTFSNAGDQPLTLTVRLDSVFDQPVPGLHRDDGAPLADDAAEAREGVLAFIQNQPEGMSSAVFLIADPKTKKLPRWKGKKNGESHSFEWSLDVPAQGAATIVTWIVQRPTLTPGEIRAATEPFVRNGRLVRPRLDAPAIASLVNFPARGLSDKDGADDPGDPSVVLAALNRFADSLGLERGEADVYYMNPKSVLEGQAAGGPLELDCRFGPVSVPFEQVAAVQGGGGRGRQPRVFLRDGHVLSGSVRLPDWKISGERGWAITLNPATLEALVLRASSADGATESAPPVFAQLTSGETLPLRLPPGTSLTFITPWGPLVSPVSDITGLWRVRQPAPASRLTLRDGTRLTVLPATGELTASSARLGPLTLQATDLAALWSPGTPPPDPDAGTEEITSLDDLPDAPNPRALLRGSSVLAATIAEPALTLLNNGTETQLETADLATLARAEGSTDSAPVFTVTLASGASFEGTLRSGTISLQSRHQTVWVVPLSQFLGWKHAAAPPAQ